MRVLVTGAGGGVAPAFIEAFLEAGAELVLVGRNAQGLEARARSYGLPYRLADLADPLSTAALAEAEPEVDGVVHLAGAFAAAPLRESGPGLLEKMLEANLQTLYHTARAFLPALVRRRGFLVGVSAAAGLKCGGKNLAAYAAAKAGVLALLRSLAEEEPALRVLALVPMAAIDTPANRRAMPGADPSRWIQPRALAEATLAALRLPGGRLQELPVYPGEPGRTHVRLDQ